MERASKTTTSMKNVESDISQAVMQVDATSASLEDLISLTQPDIRKAFANYSENVKKMDQIGKRLNRHTAQMKDRGKDYFEEWDKQENKYKNPKIQELSEQRRAELQEQYSQIASTSVGVRGALDTYLADIKEIQKYLSNDLTPKGIETITPIARRVKGEGEQLKETLKPVQGAVQRTRTEMAPYMPQGQ
jgi:archaellum component FlaC